MKQYMVKAVRSDDIYRKIFDAPMDKKDDIYRYDFMKKFEKKWDAYHCPLTAKQPGGYDVIMASKMLGYLMPQEIGKNEEIFIDSLADEVLWSSCASSIEKSLMEFVKQGIELKVKEYLFTLVLADPKQLYYQQKRY